jgi:hypothetical protein
MKFKQLQQAHQRVCHNYRDREVNIHRFIGIPLIYIGIIFEEIFSWTLGLNWLKRLTYKLNNFLPNLDISLPIPEYVTRLNGDWPFPLRSRFEKDHVNYIISPINFFIVFLNYFFRNLGKAIGWLIASIFIAPVYLFLKAYHGIKEKSLKNEVNSILINFSAEEVIEDYLDEDYTSMRFFNKNLDSESLRLLVLDAVTTLDFLKIAAKKKKKNDQEVTAFALNKSLLNKIENYFYERGVFLQRKGNDAEIIAELQFLGDAKEITRADVVPMRQGEFFICDNFYTKGMKYLSKNKDIAYFYFFNVPKHSPHYQAAMFTCGLHLKEKGLGTESQFYFQESGAQDFSSRDTRSNSQKSIESKQQSKRNDLQSASTILSQINHSDSLDDAEVVAAPCLTAIKSQKIVLIPSSLSKEHKEVNSSSSLPPSADRRYGTFYSATTISGESSLREAQGLPSQSAVT